jgi:hypothetical protein
VPEDSVSTLIRSEIDVYLGSAGFPTICDGEGKSGAYAIMLLTQSNRQQGTLHYSFIAIKIFKKCVRHTTSVIELQDMLKATFYPNSRYNESLHLYK